MKYKEKPEPTTIFAICVTVFSLGFMIWALVYICELRDQITRNTQQIERHRQTEIVLKSSMNNTYE